MAGRRRGVYNFILLALVLYSLLGWNVRLEQESDAAHSTLFAVSQSRGETDALEACGILETDRLIGLESKRRGETSEEVKKSASKRLARFLGGWGVCFPLLLACGFAYSDAGSYLLPIFCNRRIISYIHAQDGAK